ncbi:sugar transferase [Paenarthrobacter aurescens]|uniref:Polyprenyl glycosylphosphotransferase n=1 Tax=Paenarthrobacter aurescens TaxID=43663 RepID=A0A4Y3NFI4_PAEAU|nr:sugar transferase [Paenarthrobacter aurescens]MDO6145577.1 sugar transferase [Paenarthrobacter aurescens]MDO6149386.1 sugar transferase [Paenarthrobacter aurescens]MDO6160626.1 sugar transferase [Paenarthrobacter aurescens]MDO6164485.1 sugar transferase [Paenarthrobacter aurescens]GEB20023.1 polyprenyl glycosylphosphotransferase [Paenarthrobacter aurescens]
MLEHDGRVKVLLVDFLCITWAVAFAELLRFGLERPSLGIGTVQTPYPLVSVVLDVLWLMTLGALGTREPRIHGFGTEEYRRVTTASLWLFGGIAIFSYVFQLDTARGYVAVALPLGIVSLLIGRWALRKDLILRRKSGQHLRRVLVIGGAPSAAHLARQLRAQPAAGYQPVAAYLTTSDAGEPWPAALKLPVIGRGKDLEAILAAVEAAAVDSVAISGADVDPPTLRQLGWSLTARDVGMFMAPALTDVAGPRIHMQPLAGLPLIHVTTPNLEGPKAVAKRGLDVFASLVLLMVLAVPMCIVALLVKADSSGPAMFRQTRIGRSGEVFSMWKFRSMVIDAEQQLSRLTELNEGNGVLFKLKDDPRVTKVGRFIRRYSIDELPQLFNVLRGEMSLVGPRPPLPVEVETYDDFAHRRLLVKPGLTGPWQVSGRSDLSWDDSIRLDLYYVENWSMFQDMIYLLRTVRAVFGKDGAY